MKATQAKLVVPDLAWSMAVGGMIGGGIFSTLGVVIAIAGAWLNFAVAGCIVLCAGYSYFKLAEHYGESGGAFIFLRKNDAPQFAGSLFWVLIVGYVLTNAVYAFTFGQHLAHVVELGPWFARTAAIAIIALFVGLNLRGAGEAGGLEVFLVWFKLVGLAGWGLAARNPPLLSQGVPEAGIGAALPRYSWPTRAFSCLPMTATTSPRRIRRSPAPCSRRSWSSRSSTSS